MFIAYNGGPLGGNASTEWMLAGINQGAVGNRVAGPTILAGPPAIGGENTGNTFAPTGEGGNATDYRTYIDQTNQAARGFAATGTAPQNHTNAYYTGERVPVPAVRDRRGARQAVGQGRDDADRRRDHLDDERLADRVVRATRPTRRATSRSATWT